MPEPIEVYLDDLMREARLSGAEALRVRCELRDHIHRMLAEASPLSRDPTEALHMIHDQFGEPRVLGRQIAAGKGRIRVFFKRQLRRLPAAVAAAIVLIGLRATVAEAFRVPGDSVAPALPPGSRCLVYKLAAHFAPGDVIVYHPADHPDLNYLAIVNSVAAATGDLNVVRRNGNPFVVGRSRVVGRVFLNTR